MDMITSNDSNSLCNFSKSISNRHELQIIYYTECILGLLALFPNLLTLNLIWHIRIFHANLRLILINLTCNLLFYSMTIIVKALQRLTKDECTFPTSIQKCLFTELALQFPLHNALISVVILSLERLYATIRYRTYDFAKSTPYLGMFLIACAWTTTLALNVPATLTAPTDIWIPVCEAGLVLTSAGVSKTLIALFTFETAAIGITTSVFFYNRFISGHMAINRVMYNLSSRFQVNQNVQLNKALMPGIILHVLCHVPSYAFLCTIFVGGVKLEIGTKAWLWHLTFVWRLVYALVDPILMIVLNPNLRQGLEKSAIGRLFLYIWHRFGKRDLTITRDITQATGKKMNVHFDYLHQMWAVKKLPGLQAAKENRKS